MMSEFPSIILPLIFIAWVWVSVILFRIHSTGVEVVFNTKYKSMQKNTAELRKEFRTYLTFLWMVEVLTGIGVVVFSAQLLFAVH